MIKLDNKPMPKKWDKFVNIHSRCNNLILKHKDNYYCTCCHLTFKGKKKINEKEKCPFCKQKLLVKKDCVKNYTFDNNLILLDKIDDKLVIRYFYLKSNYISETKSFEHKVYEYGRGLVDDKIILFNNYFNKNMYCIYFTLYKTDIKWRVYNGYNINLYGNIFLDNIKQVIKETPYKYACLYEFAKKEKNIDLYDIMINQAIYPSFEILVKLGLYSLAYKAKIVKKEKSFEENFGISREYYSFMKKYNITWYELEILKKFKEKNIKNIRKFYRKYGIYCLDRFNENVKLDEFLKFNVKGKDIYIYLDYLRFAQNLQFDMKDKKILYAKNFAEQHDILSEKVKIIETREIIAGIVKRYNELKKNQYQNDKYIIFPAESMDALKDESKQQHHCVRNYAEDYSNAICDIYFMRLLHNPKKSLVTVEVKNNNITQKRRKLNEIPSDEENLFLEEWKETVLQKCRI